jgi:hypothetical protein
MKITGPLPGVKFKDIPLGGVFYQQGTIYMKIHPVGSRNAVTLDGGFPYQILEGDAVTPIPNATLHTGEGVS